MNGGGNGQNKHQRTKEHIKGKQQSRAKHKQNAKEDHNDKITRHNLQNYCWKLMNAFYVIFSFSHCWLALECLQDIGRAKRFIKLCAALQLCLVLWRSNFTFDQANTNRLCVCVCALNVFIAGFEAIDLLVISTINQMEHVHFSK